MKKHQPSNEGPVFFSSGICQAGHTQGPDECGRATSHGQKAPRFEPEEQGREVLRV